MSHRPGQIEKSNVSKLLPIPVLPFAPVRQDERQHYLHLIFKQFKLVNANSNNPELIKSIITQTVKNEFNIAKNSKNKYDYQHNVKKIMFNLKKFGNIKGENDNSKKNLGTTPEIENGNVNVSGTGTNVLNTESTDDSYIDQFNELKDLCIPLSKLQRHNYVVNIPTVPSPDYKLPNLTDCSHCGIKFNIDEISNNVICKFHPGKIQTTTYENLNKGKKIYGNDYTNKSFSCCNEPVGSNQGCQTLNHHVYKFKDAIDLHLSKNFIDIKSLRNNLNIDSNSKSQLLRNEKIKAIGLDCEMCYTDKGFEIMKISVVDFKTEKKLIDSIVHPDGDLIIDLNSHVSGVYEITKNALTFDELLIKLAYMSDENTIIVGHGLENDLNVLRLIYPNIVDTAILFSENKVDPRRKDPLKKIAWNYLSENIQGREHDSLEDAVVPVRIVKKHIQKILDRKRENKLNRK